MKYSFKNIILIIFIALCTFFTACDDQNQKGRYTYKITGLDKNMEGYTVKLTLRDLKTFKFETKEMTTIANGEFTISDTLSFPRFAIWSIYNGEKMYKKGEFILHNGPYEGKFKDKKIYIEGSKYNQIIYYGLENDKEFKRAKIAYENFMNGLDLQNVSQQEEDQIRKLINEQEVAKKSYFSSQYDQSNDLDMKLLTCLIGGLYFEEGSNYLSELQESVEGHFVMALMDRNLQRKKQADAMEASVAVGKSIKPFSANNLSGETYDLTNVLKENKYVLVEFWASWCGPCRAEIPHMKTAYKNFKEKGFEIVSFSLDNKQKNWEKASKDEQLPWLNISDLLAYDSPVTKMYGIRGIPANFLVDNEGKIIALDLRQDRLDMKLEELLN